MIRAGAYLALCIAYYGFMMFFYDGRGEMISGLRKKEKRIKTSGSFPWSAILFVNSKTLGFLKFPCPKGIVVEMKIHLPKWFAVHYKL